MGGDESLRPAEVGRKLQLDHRARPLEATKSLWERGCHQTSAAGTDGRCGNYGCIGRDCRQTQKKKSTRRQGNSNRLRRHPKSPPPFYVQHTSQDVRWQSDRLELKMEVPSCQHSLGGNRVGRWREGRLWPCWREALCIWMVQNSSGLRYRDHEWVHAGAGRPATLRRHVPRLCPKCRCVYSEHDHNRPALL
jgi:hypothetical protein